MPEALLNLPWQIQLSIASGYAAYLLCSVGSRAKHTAVDVTFLTLTFGLIASGVYFVGLRFTNIYASSAAAFVITCSCGALWRRYFSSMLRKILRKTNISWSDDSPNSLASMLYDSSRPVSQIAVQLEDGTWLRCDNLKDFETSPFGPCRIGPDGDVAMYLTHTVSKDGEEKELTTVKDLEFGDRITYIPASKIKRINLRHTNR